VPLKAEDFVQPDNFRTTAIQ